jgi:nucleoside-diphosphate-sugar epimerase
LLNLEKKEELKDVRILITGASGFVGSHLTETILKYGAIVRVLVRKDLGSARHLMSIHNLEVVHGDLTKFSSLRGLTDDIDLVYHLATARKDKETYKNMKKLLWINTQGVENLLRGCSKSSSVSRIVLVSSSAVYGDPGHSPICEDNPLKPNSFYGVSKAAAEMIAHAYVRTHSLPIVVARPSAIFGPRQQQPNVVPKMIHDGLRFDTLRISDPAATRDFIYVEDIVKGLTLMGITPGIEGEIFNLGTGSETSLRDLAEIISQRLPASVQIIVDQSLSRGLQEIYHCALDWSKAASRLKWAPTMRLGEGIGLTVDWYLNNIDWKRNN